MKEAQNLIKRISSTVDCIFQHYQTAEELFVELVKKTAGDKLMIDNPDDYVRVSVMLGESGYSELLSIKGLKTDDYSGCIRLIGEGDTIGDISENYYDNLDCYCLSDKMQIIEEFTGYINTKLKNENN